MHSLSQLSSNSRSGISVVEVLVALMIVSIGLLGIAGSTTLALRATFDAAHRREVAQRAATRFSLLAAGGCASATAGVAPDAAHKITERWTVSARSNGFISVTDSVDWLSARGPKAFALTTAIAC